MPPSVQWLCVAGSGPKVRWCCSAALAQVVQHAPRLARAPSAVHGSISSTPCMYFEKSITTADVAALPGEAGAAAARQRSARRSVGRQRRPRHVIRSRGITTPIGDLPVVRRVSRVERAAPGVEAHLAAHALPQLGSEAGRIRRRGIHCVGARGGRRAGSWSTLRPPLRPPGRSAVAAIERQPEGEVRRRGRAHASARGRRRGRASTRARRWRPRPSPTTSRCRSRARALRP